MSAGLRDFHNRLRILLCVGMSDLEDAGAIEPGDMDEWKSYLADPFRWFIKAGDAQVEALWTVMNGRSSRHPNLDDLLEVAPELLSHSISHYGNPTDETCGVGLVHAKTRAALSKAEIL